METLPHLFENLLAQNLSYRSIKALTQAIRFLATQELFTVAAKWIVFLQKWLCHFLLCHTNYRYVKLGNCEIKVTINIMSKYSAKSYCVKGASFLPIFFHFPPFPVDLLKGEGWGWATPLDLSMLTLMTAFSTKHARKYSVRPLKLPCTLHNILSAQLETWKFDNFKGEFQENITTRFNYWRQGI